MKILGKLTQSVVDVRQYTDLKTGTVRERVVGTAGVVADGGETLSVTVYGRQGEKLVLPQSGARVVIDCYKYESSNALFGTVFARSIVETGK